MIIGVVFGRLPIFKTMDKYKIIASGSDGNCEIALGHIMIDCGVPFSLIKDVYKQLSIIVLTHLHGDHFNLATIKKLISLRPGLRIACGRHLAPMLIGIRNIDILELNQWYKYDTFYLSIGKLYHDVDNVFIRIQDLDNYKIFRATDSSTLEGISARDYDIYAIEHNYDEETVWDIIREKEARGEYAHQKGAINSHLSKQQAQEFFYQNKKQGSILIPLHESKSSL